MDDPAVSLEEFNRLDADFHIRIAEAGGNRLVLGLTQALRTVMKPRLLEILTRIAERPADLRATLEGLRPDHHEIHRALVEGRGVEGADTVERHRLLPRRGRPPRLTGHTTTTLLPRALPASRSARAPGASSSE